MTVITRQPHPTRGLATDLRGTKCPSASQTADPLDQGLLVRRVGLESSDRLDGRICTAFDVASSLSGKGARTSFGVRLSCADLHAAMCRNVILAVDQGAVVAGYGQKVDQVTRRAPSADIEH